MLGRMRKKQHPVGTLTKHDNDIICGRGNGVQYHPGNVKYREFINNYRLEYLSAQRYHKGNYCRLVYDDTQKLDPPGRFLAQDKKNQLYYEIEEKKVLDKIAQALRENAPELKSVIPKEERNHVRPMTIVRSSPCSVPESESKKSSSIESFQFSGDHLSFDIGEVKKMLDSSRSDYQIVDSKIKDTRKNNRRSLIVKNKSSGEFYFDRNRERKQSLNEEDIRDVLQRQESLNLDEIMAGADKCSSSSIPSSSLNTYQNSDFDDLSDKVKLEIFKNETKENSLIDDVTEKHTSMSIDDLNDTNKLMSALSMDISVMSLTANALPEPSE